MDSFICSYCNSVFSTQTNLNVHLKNAKYCKKIQSNNASQYVCSKCFKIFKHKKVYVQHENECQANPIEQKLDTLERLLTNVSHRLSSLETVCFKNTEHIPKAPVYVPLSAKSRLSRPRDDETGSELSFPTFHSSDSESEDIDDIEI